MALLGQIEKALIIDNAAFDRTPQFGKSSNEVAQGMHPGNVEDTPILRPPRQVDDQFINSSAATFCQPSPGLRFRGCRLANTNGAPALTFRPACDAI